VRPRSSKPPAGTAFDAGIRLLASRSHSRAELLRKLTRRGFGAEDVEAAVGRLVERGYVDDAAFAAAHVRRRAASRGAVAISAELASRGVPRHVAGAAVAELDRTSQLQAATRMAERLCAAKRPAGYQELLRSVGAKLLRRGFSESIARAACAAVWARTPAGPQA
jgi:regulatory protein